MKHIFYKKGYKYQLAQTCSTDISYCITPEKDINTEYLGLNDNGVLIIRKGYAWDGPSGPTIDTKNFMRGSLVHDALYQLIRMGFLEEDPHRKLADQILYDICREDGMSWIRAKWVYRGVRVGGGYAADPSNRKQIIVAP
jgi:hypothetical protein